MDEIVSFGAWVQQRRKALDLTQAALAKLIGYAVITIKKIEQDERRPSREMAELLAEHLLIPDLERDAFLRRARGQFVSLSSSSVPREAVSLSSRGDNTQVGTSGRTISTAVPNAELPQPPGHLERGLAGTRQMPGTITALIGREAEEAVVSQLLRREDVRLLTLTGPGGVGKTRLALEVATANKQWFADGVAFVALAPLADPALVLPTVARTLGLREAPGHSVTEALITYLQDKRMLLVLDNLEHVLESVPQVAEILSACLLLVVLVTSRAALRLRGEQEYAVGPLALPDPKRLPPLEQLGAIASVQLFMQRARQVNLVSATGAPC